MGTGAAGRRYASDYPGIGLVRRRHWTVVLGNGSRLEWNGNQRRAWKAWGPDGVLRYHGEDPGAAMEEALR